MSGRGLTSVCNRGFPSPVPHCHVNALENRCGHAANHEVRHERQSILMKHGEKGWRRRREWQKRSEVAISN